MSREKIIDVMGDALFQYRQKRELWGVRGWEALPGNQNHSPYVIERWLCNEMVGAINHILSTLSQLENSK